MNIKELSLAWITLLATGTTLSSITRLTAQAPAGIPEPGLIMYGTVTNVNGNLPLMQGNVRWTVAGGGSSAAIDSIIVAVNGQYFYLARIPFETRAVSELNFTPTANTLPLNQTAASFTRTVTVFGTNANIASPALPGFTFGAVDRGKVERVNLQVSLAVDPSLDTDGDSMPDWAERIAGTDPNNANSVFKISSDIEPNQQGGLTITWSSVPGKVYSVSRSSNPGQEFVHLATGIPSGGATTTYTDNTASDNGPYFYRLTVE